MILSSFSEYVESLIFEICVFQDDDFIIMVLEYCDGGSLSSYIQSHGRVEEDIARRFMKQIGIIHFQANDFTAFSSLNRVIIVLM